MKSKLLYELTFYVLHDLQANLPQTSPFSICPNGFSEKLPSNVYSTWHVQGDFVFRAKSSFMCNSLDPRTLPWWKLRKNFWHFTKIEICIAITMFTVATWNCNKAYAAWLCNCFFGWFHCFHFKVICILLVCCVDWLAC